MLRALFEAGGPLVPEVRPDELAQYESYLALLIEWNERMSLVSPKSLATAFGTHFVDSIRIVDSAVMFEHKRVGDVGTGAGFPGIVHAIRFPKTPITLFERNQKKQSFLGEVITVLKLDHVTLEESFPDTRQSGLFYARAVMPREEFFPFFRKRLTENSVVVANLGTQRENSAPPADFIVEKNSRYTLPQDCGDRIVEVLRFDPRR